MGEVIVLAFVAGLSFWAGHLHGQSQCAQFVLTTINEALTELRATPNEAGGEE
jgi:hypothetical protein